MRQIKIKKHVEKCQRLLDICCGEEYYLLKSLKNIVNELYGIDAEVQTKKDANIYLQRQYINNKLNYSSNFFDVVIMSAALEHLKYPVEILHEVYRILKQNGKLILTTPTPRAEYILKVLRTFHLSELEEDSHKYFFTKKELYKILRKMGYKKIKVNLFQMGLNALVITYK